MEQHEPSIMICENYEPFIHLLERLLHASGYRTVGCTTSTQALALLHTTRPALVLLDLWLEEPAAGVRVIDGLRRDPATAPTPIVVCTATTRVLPGTQAYLHTRQCVLLDKFVAFPVLAATIQAALEAPR
jgi:CheY-like chemotaxis protein